ncbi:MAG: homoserine dehydrogenase [Ferrovum sp. 37-45-19]|uniref:homoserine dehydrogenase n=1 Tax=Ferrovum sp. JA12 TaxID=1356299 RepID=UPI000703B52F|nr:homoserine dehydrogenase [Ferrovum sp. JA12]OYV79115.1 MAG: homoserine dehydrogenase [Ferrovum sp. 21-44-67]OYV93756.1 MAG: homoserine dehydrogenase [Ferrovum sp. 37-45-19]OZB32285.1 MAG: homoserine dehydrogenase [Ferrovum sp. 34-44-207]HQT81365.1 homoserine dehydrogenase [Ferrovaceae bacterium]KRH78541.1 homoserine dehydrogenase [Ferrovum sp. JA12]
MKTLRVGLLGLGVVGGGTFDILKRNGEEIARRAGKDIVVTCAAVREKDLELVSQRVGNTIELFTDPHQVVESAKVDIVIEVMGGIHPAKELVLKAISLGKHVVTANKALLALHGNEIFKAAHDKSVMIGFEAAVAGGIPIIKALREGLSANRIEWIAGIINGTSNFILSSMRERGISFAEALEEAQALGYAEADPTFDVEGVDAAHKLSLLSAIAFGIPIQFDKAYTEGVSELTAKDISYAEEFGYRIKLLGITQRTDQGIELRVHPTLIPEKRLIANVEGVMNAILVSGDAVGSTLYYGPGAGAEPTGSAVVADLVDVARMTDAAAHQRVPYLAFQADCLMDDPVLTIAEVYTSYYLRMSALDRPGVLADVTRILANLNISIEAMLQREPSVGEERVDVIILTHRALERDVNQAIQEIEQLDTISGPLVRIRLENLAS